MLKSCMVGPVPHSTHLHVLEVCRTQLPVLQDLKDKRDRRRSSNSNVQGRQLRFGGQAHQTAIGNVHLYLCSLLCPDVRISLQVAVLSLTIKQAFGNESIVVIIIECMQILRQRIGK